MHSQRGQSLLEVVVAGAIAATMILVVSATIGHSNRKAALAAATAELRAVFQRTRMLAVARDRAVGLKFIVRDGTWQYAVYEDGDGDGVRANDIARGTDREIEQPRAFIYASAKIGVPSKAVRDPMSSGLLTHRLPVRFNRSTICSFSRNGEATNGSVVLTNGKEVRVLQVHPMSARISVWKWNGTRWQRGE